MTLASGSPSSSSTLPAITPWGTSLNSIPVNAWPGETDRDAPENIDPRPPYIRWAKPGRWARSEYLPGSRSSNAKPPLSSVSTAKGLSADGSPDSRSVAFPTGSPVVALTP